MEAMASNPIDIYQELPRSKGIKLSSLEPFTATYVKSLLPTSNDLSAPYDSRIKNKQLALENPAKQSRRRQLEEQRKARRAKDAARRKLNPLSRTDATVRGVWRLKREETNYELFLPLHQLWKSYMAELLNLSPRPEGQLDYSSLKIPNAQGIQAKLVKADFHGSILTIRRAKNPAIVGCGGIVILETENTFKVVTKANQLKVLPKCNSTFVLNIPIFSSSKEPMDSTFSEPSIEFELYGDQFAFRSSDRATRKFKHKLV